jgi:hypothetical protein
VDDVQYACPRCGVDNRFALHQQVHAVAGQQAQPGVRHETEMKPLALIVEQPVEYFGIT